MTCIIVDDEPLAVRLLESFVEKTPDLELLSSYTDSVEAAAAIKEGRAQLLFLDIQMPDLDGMELARIVPPQTRIVFTTAFKEYAFESYEVFALDFLLKPIRYSKFLAAVEKARQWFGTASSALHPSTLHPSPSTPSPTSVFIRVDGELRQLPIEQIVCVSGMKDYVMFYIEGERRPLITHMTMKAVEEMLPSDRFMRVSRSHIVALEHIRKVDRNDCIYLDGESQRQGVTDADLVIHVTEAYLPAFRAYLAQRMK